MATSNKSSNRSGNRRTQTKKQKEAQLEREEQLRNLRGDIIRSLILLVALLLFISNFGIGGTVGNSVSNFFFGAIGLFAYIFPLVIIVFMILSYSHLRARVNGLWQKVAGAVLFMLFIGLFTNLIVFGKEMATPAESFEYAYEAHNGGGFLGGVLAFYFVKWFGLVGAYIIAVIGVLIAFVLITNKLFMQMFSEKTYEGTEKAVTKVREYNSPENRENRKQRRMDRKAPRGVSADTIVGDSSNAKSDEMHELFANEENAPIVSNKTRASLSSDGSTLTSVPVQETVVPSTSQFQIHGDFSPENASYERTASAVNAMESMPEEKEPVVASSGKKKIPNATPEEQQKMQDEINQQIDKDLTPSKPYVFPSVSLLKQGKGGGSKNKETELRSTAAKLEQTLASFGVAASVTNVSCGPAVTRYEIRPEAGVKVSKIVNLQDDIKLNLAAADIRIEAPVPGTSLVGIEVPNKEASAVAFRELIDSPEYQNSKSNLTFAVGKDLGGKIKITDIAKMPHLLIAGATGSGKSVCINTIIMSILYKADPKDVRMIMIDPKVVELSVYNGIPHLMIPVVTDAKKAAGALQWAVNEMTERYEKFAGAAVRDLMSYNAKMKKECPSNYLPQIIVIVDELADLMMVASSEVEEAICRLAQLARAAGIHLIIATQRPSVNVITGLIKANMPSRIAFSVTSSIDSRTILDMGGAEKLLGKGDMLFYPQGLPKPERVQGAFVTDEEVSAVVADIRQKNGEVTYVEAVQNRVDSGAVSSNQTVAISDGEVDNGMDPLVFEAAKIIVDKEKASIGSLQRYLKIGFNRAARIMEQLEGLGVVGPEMGTKPRTVLMDSMALEELINQETNA